MQRTVPVEAMPAPVPVEAMPAPAPVEAMPAPAPVEAMPAPAPVEAVPALASPSKASPVFAPVYVVEGANTRPARPPLADPPEPLSSATGAAPLQRMAASAFHIPNPIMLGQSVVAQLHIDPGKDLEAVRAALSTATAGRPGELQAQMVEIAKHMRAELKSDEKVLRIQAISPPNQPVKAGETTVWTWSVIGLEPGNHELTVTLLKLLPDGEKAVPTPVYRVVVKVPETGLLDRIIAWVKKLTDLVSVLEALVAAVLALLATAGIAWAKKRKSGNDEKLPKGGDDDPHDFK